MVCGACWERVPSPTLVPALIKGHYIYELRELYGHALTCFRFRVKATIMSGTRETQRCSRSFCRPLSIALDYNGFRLAFGIIPSSQDCSHRLPLVGNESEQLLDGARVVSDNGITYL